jgi:hypothetical protein
MAYISTAEFKSYRGITDTSRDGLILDTILSAQQHVDTFTRRTFEAIEDTTRYIDAEAPHVDGRFLHLREVGDLCAITEVVNGDGVLVASADYVTMPRHAAPFYALRLKQNSNVFWTYSTTPEDAIAITGRWAYSVTANQDIKQAMLVLVNFYYTQRDTGTFDAVAYPESGILNIPQGIAQTVEAILKPYRRLI